MLKKSQEIKSRIKLRYARKSKNKVFIRDHLRELSVDVSFFCSKSLKTKNGWWAQQKFTWTWFSSVYIIIMMFATPQTKLPIIQTQVRSRARFDQPSAQVMHTCMRAQRASVRLIVYLNHLTAPPFPLVGSQRSCPILVTYYTFWHARENRVLSHRCELTLWFQLIARNTY